MRWLAIALMVVMLASALQVAGQATYHYNQYMNHLTPLNHAYSVLEKGVSVHLVGRKQWVGIDGAPTTFILDGTVPLPSIKSTIGVVAVQDKVAVEDLTDVQFFFAKYVQLAPSTGLAASIGGGMRRYFADFASVSATDPVYRDNISETIGALSFSIMVFDPEKYYVGVSMPHISMRGMKVGSIEHQRNYSDNVYVTAAYLANLGPSIDLKPAFLVTYNPAFKPIVDVSGMVFLKRQFGFGATYRTTNDIGTILSYRFLNGLRVGYSYQQSLGGRHAQAIHAGTHEISIGVKLADGLVHGLL